MQQRTPAAARGELAQPDGNAIGACIDAMRAAAAGLGFRSGSLSARMLRNASWSLGGAGISQGSALITALLVARILGATDFGKLALIQTTVLLISTIGEFGLGTTVTKFVGRWRAQEPARAGRLIGWSIRATSISGTVLAAATLLLAGRLPAAVLGGLSAELRAACGLLVFEMLNRVQSGALAGLEAFDSIARVQSVRGLMLLPCAALGAWFDGVEGALIGMGTASLASFLVGQHILARRCGSYGIVPRWNSRLEPGVLGMSASLWASLLMMTGSAWLASMVLSGRPSGMSELGLYNAADKWKTALLFLPNLLFQVNVSMLSHSRAAGDKKACVRIVAAGFGSSLAVAGAGAAFMAAFAPLLMTSYGKEFSSGAPVLIFSVAAGVASAVYTVGSGVLWALGKPSIMLCIDAFKTSILILLCFTSFVRDARDLALATLLSLGAGCVAVVWSVFTNLNDR